LIIKNKRPMNYAHIPGTGQFLSRYQPASKYLRSAMLLFLCFSWATLSLAQVADIVASPQAHSGAVGSTFDITLSVVPEAGVPDITGVQFVLNFDPAVLQVVGDPVAGENIQFTSPNPIPYDNTAGTISFLGGNFTGIAGTFEVVTFTVEAIAASAGTAITFDYAAVPEPKVTAGSTNYIGATPDITVVVDNPNVNQAPTVTLTSPISGTTIVRGADITFEATATDPEEGDLTSTISWSSSDPQFNVVASGSPVVGKLRDVGTKTVTASVFDSEGLLGSDAITLTVPPPAIAFAAPASGATLSGPAVTVSMNTTGLLLDEDEHFHFYITPADPDNPDYANRISTFSQPGQTTFTFDGEDGIVPGANTIVAIAATSSHVEFTDASARAVVDFTVAAPAAAKALFEITPDEGINATTYAGKDKFQLTNLSTDGLKITSLTIDLSTGVLPDMIFDPVGAGGDVTAECFEVDASSANTVGMVDPGDICVDPFSQPREGGYDVLTVSFTDFDPGELFQFSTDVDPNSIQGANGGGGVSGLECAGATITITFEDGTVAVSNLYEDGSLGGAQTVSPPVLYAPTITVQDIPATPATVGNQNQTVLITGEPNAYYSLLQLDGRLFGGDFNVSDPTYYANQVRDKAIYNGQLDASGQAAVSVTLLRTPGNNSAQDAGINHFMAVQTPVPYAVDEAVSQTSNVVILYYEPTANQAPVVTLVSPASGTTIVRGADITFEATATDPEEGDLTSSINWSSSDPQFNVVDTGSPVVGKLRDVGTKTVTASVFDGAGAVGSDAITLTVPPPAISFAAPAEGSTLTGTAVTVEMNTTGLLLDEDEHFHFYINPVDPDNPDYTNRISTFSQPGQTTFTFDGEDGIVDGANTIVAIAATSSHVEFTDASARAVVNFNVTVPNTNVFLTIDPAVSEVLEDATFSVDILVEANDQEVNGAQAFLNYDPAVLQALSISEGSAFDFTLTQDIDNTTGAIDFAAGSTGTINLPSGTFVLATIQFQAVGGPTSDLSFSSTSPRESKVTMAGSGTSILTGTNGGVVNITPNEVCNITSAVPGAQTCQTGGTNPTYDQDVAITYEGISTGSLVVNGQTFAVTGSPQTVTLTGLAADGQPVDLAVAFPDAATTCEFFQAAAFTAPTVPMYEAVGTDVTDCGATDGTITITGLAATTSYLVAIGGAVPAQFYSSDAAGTIEITGLGADGYDVVVTLDGCSGVATPVTIGAPAAPEYTVATVDPTTCSSADGSLTIQVSFAAAAVEYSIDGGQSWGPDNVFSALPDGTYNVVVRYTDGSCPVDYDANPVVLTGPVGVEICGNGIDDDCDPNTPDIDSTAPVITGCPSATLIAPEDDCTFIVPDYTGQVTVTDGCDSNPTVVQSPVPGTVIDANTLIVITATDAAGLSSQCSFTAEVATSIPCGETTNFVLVDTDANLPVSGYDPLLDGATINITTVTAPLSIIYNPGVATPGSVVFSLIGPDGPYARTESKAPYALNGDSNGDYAAYPFVLGDYSLTATVYSSSGGSGDVLETQTIQFAFVDGEPPVNQPPVASAGTDQSLTDTDENGTEPVTLDGSASSDTDGTIVSYVWTAAGVTIPDGMTPTADFPVGTTVVTLTVTDDDGATATDEAVITVGAPVNQPPVANAGTDQILTDTDENGTEPVTLDGSATGDADGTIVSYLWTAAGVTIPGGVTPTADFPVGTTVVTLTVTDDDGATATDEVVITVATPTNDPPVANAGPDQTVLDADENGTQPVTLDGSASSDADGTIVSYVWSATGVTIPDGVTPTADFPVGTTVVTLTVTDEDGATAIDEVVITVTAPVNQPPLANAGPDQTLTDTDNLGSVPVTLDGSGSSDPDGTIVSYAWSATGVTIPNGVAPTADFPVGTTVVTLTVTDDDGATATDEVSVTVLPGVGSLSNFVLVDATANTEIRNLTDNDLLDKALLPAELSIIYEPTQAIGSIVFNLTGPVNFEKKESMAPYALNGDSNGDYKPFDFPNGTYTLTGSLYSGSGGSGTLLGTETITFTVLENGTGGNLSPVAAAGADQTVTDTDENGTELVTLNGSASFDPDGTIASYVWSASGVAIPGGPLPTATFPVGTTIVTLTVTDAEGATATDQVAITVATPVNQPPVADAGADQSAMDTDQNGTESVTLDGSDSFDPDGAIASYDWSAAGLTIPAVASPTVDFPVGTTIVTLTVTDDDGATATDQVVITVTSPSNQLPVANAGFDKGYFDVDGNGTHEVTLDGSNSFDPDGTIVSYVWSAAGVTIPDGVKPTADFPVGTTIVTLAVTDDDGAIATDQVEITVTAPANQPPLADAGPDQTLSDADDLGFLTVTLDGSGSSDPDGTIVSYEWSATGVTIPNGVAPTATFPVGTTIVTLTVTDDDGAIATDQVEITVTVPANQPPLADAGPDQVVTDTDGLGALDITLDGSGSSDPDGSIVSYAWSASGVSIPNGVAPTASFPVGTTVVTLTVTDDDGATATDQVSITVFAGGDGSASNFVLVDATADVAIRNLTDNDLLDKSVLPAELSIIYEPTQAIGSVVFDLSGPASNSRTESKAPYALNGDSNGDYEPFDFPDGVYTLTATLFASSGGSGTLLGLETITFTVTQNSMASKQVGQDLFDTVGSVAAGAPDNDRTDQGGADSAQAELPAAAPMAATPNPLRADVDFRVVPNPVFGTELRLELNRPIDEAAELVVVALTGQVLHRESLAAEAGRQSITLDLTKTSLVAGQYFLRLQLADGTLVIRKFIRS
jgi:hypothetical protein